MPQSPSAGSARPHSASWRRRLHRGFTIIEVMMASIVMVLGITTSLLVLDTGMHAVDTARNMTLAAQIMQSEMEILRLQNWAQIRALPEKQQIDTSTTITSGTSTALDDTLNGIASRFTCVRLVTDISGRSDIKRIVLVTSWQGIDGRTHTVSYETRYAKNGLADYFYVSH